MADPAQPSSDPKPPAELPAEAVEIMGGPSPLEAALTENRGKFFAGIAITFLAISGVFVLQHQKQSKGTAGAEAFTKATTVEELETVAREHAGTLGGGNALIAAGDLLATGEAPDPAGALAKFEQFLTEYPEHPLRAQVLFAIGMQQQAAGKNTEAETVFQRILDEAPQSAVAPGALLRLGDLAWDADDKEAARRYYERIASAKYAGNEFISRSDERLRQLDEPSPSEPSEKQKALKAKKEAEKAEREAAVKKAQEEAKKRAEEAAKKAAEAAAAEVDAPTGEADAPATEAAAPVSEGDIPAEEEETPEEPEIPGEE